MTRLPTPTTPAAGASQRRLAARLHTTVHRLSILLSPTPSLLTPALIGAPYPATPKP